jgi:hypothetical protein
MSWNIEKKWTKREIFVELNCDEDKYKNTPQFCATAFILRKCDYSYKIIKEWYDNCCRHHLINDELILDKDNIFVENRHDQSLLSLTLKRNNYKIFSNQYEFGKHLPIDDCRLKF